jgi:hypothetical protein
VADNAFSKVKTAISAQADAILAEYGVKHHKEGAKLKGDWTTGFLCPFCGDKSGSASFTHELFMRCHQCGYKGDVFDWLSKHIGKKPWDVCKALADRLNVTLPKGQRQAKSTRAMPVRMTEEILAAAIADLWDHKDAAPARELLAERKLDDSVTLTHLEVGWIRGWIVFASRDERGVLHDRYRGWNPANPKLKWLWHGQGSGGPGIWPCRHPEKGAKIWMAEGESDVLSALCRLRMHENGWHVVTWTAGATSSPQPKDIPRWMHGREVHVAYDNDVFQGPVYQDYYVETKPGKDANHARMALQQRLRNLLEKVCPTLTSLKCNVVVRQCPVKPTEKFGGDLRDWIDSGGRDLSDWPAFRFEDLPSYGRIILDLPFAEVFDNPHKLVRTRVQVEAIARDDVTMSDSWEMLCEMGQHPACAACPGARLFPDRMIDGTDFQRELAVGLEQQNVTEMIVKNVIQKPRGCPRVEVVPLSVTNGHEWRGCQPGKVESAQQRSLHVFSDEPPSLSGEMEIEGIAYPNARGNGLVFIARSVRQLDKVEVDLAPVMQELLQECPAFTDNVADIDAYLARRARDLAYHVTKIHGRRDIHIAHDLLMHSVLRASLWGAVQRSWLDICIYGDTRSGKSLTFRRLMDFHGLGISHTAVSNVSRAGLLLGADKNGMCKPGAMPRCNGKAMILDELHFLVQNSIREHPMSWMQSARDEGIASGVKIYGNRDLPAAVRLGTIANWMRNRRHAFEFDCEHMGALYGAPETLARLDFGLCVSGDPEQRMLDKVDQFWTKERTRTLIMRAWSQDPSQVVIDDAAFELAKAYCEDWNGVYDSESLPLFTHEEKCYSLMRIALAVANICFSHPRDDPYSVHVRMVHVQWAANWLTHVWQSSGYDIYSQKRKGSQTVIKPFHVERLFLCNLHMNDPLEAASRLSMFLTPFTPSEIVTLTGLEIQAAHNWLSRMVACHVFERSRSQNGYNLQYQLTSGARQMLGNMIRYAETEEEQWLHRLSVLKSWNQSEMARDPDVPTMATDTWDLLDSSGNDNDNEAAF